jgi:hypothetical protein
MTEYIELPALVDTSSSFWTTIQKFSEIDIQPNTLVLCDIDDTLLHHPGINNSWNVLINTFFYTQHCFETGNYDKYESNKKSDEFCNHIFETVLFQHTDRDGFFSMVEKATEFVFVTARHEVAKEFTYGNLRSIDVDPDKYKVHFCNGVAKGEYIVRHFDLAKYDHVVFIDDQTPNLRNVLLRVNHASLKLYHFKRDKTIQHADYYPLPPGFNPLLRFDGENIVHIQEYQYSDPTQDSYSESDSDSVVNLDNEF